MSKPSRKKRVAVLQEYIEENRLSQQEFAERIGVTQGLVWQWIHGVTAISPEYAKNIEEKTGIPRLHLLYPQERVA